VDADRRKVEAGRRDGVRVDDRPPLAADFVPFEEWSPPPGVPVLLCTKCYDNAAVLARRPDPAWLVPIQNGFDPDQDRYGHGLEGIASFVSECPKDRPHTRITRAGELHVGGRFHLSPGPSPKRGGEQAGGPFPPRSDDSRPLAPPSFLGKGVGGLGSGLFRTLEVPSIEPIKYAKLMYNAAISPVAAAAGIDNGQLLSAPTARRLFFALIQENYQILTAAGVPLGKVGPFRPRTVSWILRRKWLAGLMAKAFEPSLRGTYCSMAGDIERGRTEMDNYNGHLIRLAERTETPCPLNRGVFDLVTRMAAEGVKPHLGALEEVEAVQAHPWPRVGFGQLHSQAGCRSHQKG
jgi:2-dehydropantoate 2-reductase